MFCIVAQAERQAVNTKIQGSAADLVKSSLVLLDRTLRGKMTDVQLIHQIHDELLFQVCFIRRPVRIAFFYVSLMIRTFYKKLGAK